MAMIKVYDCASQAARSGSIELSVSAMLGAIFE